MNDGDKANRAADATKAMVSRFRQRLAPQCNAPGDQRVIA